MVSMTLSVPEWDALMVRATSDAARPIAPSAKAGDEVERDLEDALAASLVRAAKPVTAAYLITGGTQNEWKKSGLGAYFAAGIRPVGAIDLIRANPKAWADLMYVHKDGRLESSGFGPYGCEIGGVGELKVMSVRRAGEPIDVPEDLRPTRRA